MKYLKFYIFSLFAIILLQQHAYSQISFTQDNTALGGGTIFSNEDCAVDMNGDFLDDVVRIAGYTLYIDYQKPDGTFEHQTFPIDLTNQPGWSICAGDLDGNGYNDLLLGDGDALSFVYANANGTDYTEVEGSAYIFSQRTTMADIDNDGHLDAFTCHDIDQSHPYRNDGNGNMILDQTLIETIDQPGNYAAIWVDYDNDQDIDLYVTKCRGGTSPGDPTRTNRLYQNNSDGTFSEVGTAANMDDNAQSWATSFEDFDNDGDFDAFIVNHDDQNRFMLNNGDGTFTDIIDQTGINPNDLGAWENATGDFDNDGFIDIFSELNNEIYYNNGDLTFTGANYSFNDGGIGDFNNDGFLDVVTGSSIRYNNGNDNNWVKVNTIGIISNKNGIGARVEIHGDWGIQIREVRSGQSFSPMSSLTVHFGIGQAASIDQIVVKWPSGMITTLDNPEINTTHNMTEAECLLAPVDLTIDGSTELCPGETVNLSAPDGFIYQWNNGATSQTITVSEAGSYTVTLNSTTDSCVSLANPVLITIIEEDIPLIELSGEEIFCQGESITLTASNGTNYLWSTGETGQTIEVTTSGDYTVSSDAICSSNQVVSDVASITVLPAPPPIVETIDDNGDGTYTITASGDDLSWFDQATGGIPLAQSNSFQTPDLMGNNTSYFVESTTTYGGEIQFGGKLDNSGDGGLPASGGFSYFNAFEPFTLKQVTVYVPSNAPPGNRTITLNDASGTVLDQLVVNLSQGEHTIDLDFEVPEGTLLSLQCLENNLFRNNSNVNYPYDIGDVGSITGSLNGNSFYYYFYNWQIEKQKTECISERVEVQLLVGVNDLEGIVDLSVYPNPANDQLYVDFASAKNHNLCISLYDVLGRLVWEKKVTATSATTTEQIDVSHLPKGAYQFTALAKEGQQTFKVMVQ